MLFNQFGQPESINLLLRHGVGQSETTYLNLFVNYEAQHTTGAGATGPQPLYWFNASDPTNPLLPPWTYPISTDTSIGTPTRPLGPLGFENRAFELFPKHGDIANTPYLFTGDAGYGWPQGHRNTLRFGVDLGYYGGGTGVSSYLLGGAAISPMDVRIEATIYAQNGTFFIIPGLPLNPNAGSDSRSQALLNATNNNPNAPAGSMARIAGTDPLFPFADEPYDCRITIVGAISENFTASAAEQGEWMKHWGWIPQVYGSTGKDLNYPNLPAREIPRQHLFVNDVNGATLDMRTEAEKKFYDAANNVGITRGLRFIYDPALAMPYVGYSPGNRAFRSDMANFDQANPVPDPDRALPALPRLPVCPGFVFNGEMR